ncbi:RrF2 family transcriptional regulator [Polaribacter aquimarinus]|uniref:Transcriptional regulator n=1 Tax=Polaribacter aquimarinus TaxID=2100726 RepID=A0A2U2J9R6_9FLAO|nr:Rrf2 family transcriptional regulator [Polaribacter aquimarinus]PWG05088.1 transcriptional regulator [Polaribacter aquimarinus]
MLTKSSKYAIRAVLYLTNTGSVYNKMGAKQIAEKLEIPAPFLAKTMQELSRNKIITSVKGPNGGFYLTIGNKKKTLYDIIAAIDNIDKFEECFLGQLECNEDRPCVVHHLYTPFKNKLLTKLKTKSILEMAKEFDANNNISDILNS